GLGRGVPPAGHVALRNRSLLDRPDRPTGDAIEDIQPRLLGRLRHGLDWLSVDDEVRENRRRGNVVVPDPVMHELEVPLALAGVEIERDQRLPAQSISWTMAPVVITGWHLHWEIDGA